MRDDRRRQIEEELAGWREARRREEDAEPGSPEDVEAEADSERHRLEFERMRAEAREEQQQDEERSRRDGPGPRLTHPGEDDKA